MADDGYLSAALKVLSTVAVAASTVNPYVKVAFMAATITADFVQGWNASKRDWQNANEETRQNAKKETRQNVNEETRQNVNEETRQNVNEETRQNAKKETRQNAKKETRQNAKKETRQNAKILQCRLIEGVAEKGGLVYKQEVVRYSQEPYTARYSDPTDTITGIACVPLSAEIQSPEAQIIEGGINSNFVTIRLTPVKKGTWACDIVICGKSRAAKPSAAIQSAAKPAIETGRADASSSERSSRTIPQCSLVEGTAEERDALHKKTIFLQSREPYDYKYSKPGYTFTGISCLPVSAEIQSPDAEVISGGINCSSVTIRLTPILEGDSSCCVVVCGKLCTTGPSAEVSKQQTGRADASASERSSRTIPQCRRLVEGTPEERDALQDMTFARRSREPYDYEYSKPGYTFTGISCLPVSAEIPSPEAEVISGGINCSSVTIRLTPVEEGEWACRVLVCGRLCTTGPSAEVPKQTGRADASASERSSRTIPQCRRLVEGTPEERDALQDMTFARRSREPYDYEYSKPGYTFTGISCLPVSAEVPSPEAEVISGGINCSSVTIRLTPVEEGEWACRVVVCGRL